LIGGGALSNDLEWRAQRLRMLPDRPHKVGRTAQPTPDGGHIMLYYALVFFIVAIVAAALGFGGIAAGAASIAKVLFFIFLVIFLVTLVMGVVRR
jgi:uncharacterized membrane protein YtjA (UPF0391 family)